MADMRAARRTAERAAREALATTMVGSVGDLGEAAAARLDLADAVIAAQQKRAEYGRGGPPGGGRVGRGGPGAGPRRRSRLRAGVGGGLPVRVDPGRAQADGLPAAGTAAGPLRPGIGRRTAGGRRRPEAAGEYPQPAAPAPAADHARAAVPDTKTGAT